MATMWYTFSPWSAPPLNKTKKYVLTQLTLHVLCLCGAVSACYRYIIQQQCTYMLHIRIHTQRMWITLNMGCHSCEVIMTWKRAQLIEVRHSNQNALTYVHIGGVNGMNFFIACARMHTFCRHWHEFYISRTLKISHAVRIYFYTAYTAHVCYVYILKCQYAWHSHLDLHLYMFCEDAVTQLYGFLGLHIKKSACLLALHTFTHSGLRERIDFFPFNHRGWEWRCYLFLLSAPHSCHLQGVQRMRWSAVSTLRTPGGLSLKQISGLSSISPEIVSYCSHFLTW